ncbi:MAG: glycosyltransferase [Ardenticatenia bacterium]|nr:MAG: glycosyltransferase [Ardenticatenia bacterium]
MPDTSPHVLMLANDIVAPRMAGPGIRAWELARTLAAHTTVTLLAPHVEPPVPPPSSLRVAGVPLGDDTALHPFVTAADVVVCDAFGFQRIADILPERTALVADAYDPFLLENLEWWRTHALDVRQRRMREDVSLLARLFQRADFVICASERQRDFWLGMLAAWGRLTPTLYENDPTLRTFVALVPFGLPDEPPPSAPRPFLRGVHPAVDARSRVIVWGGGVWEWLDPFTAIRAVALLREQLPDVRLVFPGMRHPNPVVPESRALQAAQQLAAELDLLDTHVLFVEQWVPYTARAAYLLEADVGLSLHRPHIETHFAFRTRLLDYIWAGLPMVVSSGDALSEHIAAWGLGEVVPPEDENALAEALLRVLQHPQEERRRRAEAFAQAREALRWSRVAQPLIAFCRAPRRAPPPLWHLTPVPVEEAKPAAQKSVWKQWWKKWR